ncbi:MAG: hypothetical protein IPM49_11745 [Flavobacteriales bacterium]|nr:hypothetical protein [Flavobacteriales bacterium]
MIKHLLFVLLLAWPCASRAQQPNAHAPLNAPTLAVLEANRPPHIEQSKWLKMMEQPANRSLYPLRVTQAMLDTLDTEALDRRFQYVMSAPRTTSAGTGH